MFAALRGRFWLAAFGLLAALCQPLSAQSPFALFPEKTPIIVKSPGIDTLQAKVGAFLDAALPDMAKGLKAQMAEGLKMGTEGRDLKGIAKDKPIYVTIPNLADLTAEQEAGPAIGVLVPITKYADFKAVFKADELKTLKTEEGIDSLTIEEKTIYMLDKGSFVVLSPFKGIVKDYAAKQTGPKAGADIEKAFGDSDIGVFVDTAVINDLYGAQIKGFRLQVDALMGLAAGAGGLDKKQMEQTKEMITGLFQAVEDSTAFVMGLNIKGDGVGLKFASRFGKDSDIGKFLNDAKANAFADLDTLPSGKAGYTAMSGISGKLGKALQSMGRSNAVGDEDEKAKKIIEESLAAVLAAGQKQTLAFATLNPMVSVEVQNYKDGPKALAAEMNMFKAMTETATFGDIPLKKKPTIKENVGKVNDLSFTAIEFELDFDKAPSVLSLPEESRDAIKAMMMKMMGGNSLKLFLAGDKDRIVQVSGGDWAAAERAVQDYVKGAEPVGKNAAFQLSRKNLPAESSMLVLFETTALMSTMFDYIKDLGQMFPGGADQIPELKFDKDAPKSYMGVAVTLKPEHGAFELFVPSATVKAIHGALKPLLNKGD